MQFFDGKSRVDKRRPSDSGGFTIFSLVDALTRLSQKVCYVGDRTELDAKIGQLLALAA